MIYWLNGNLVKFSHTNRMLLCQQCNGKSNTNKSTSKTPQTYSSPWGCGQTTGSTPLNIINGSLIGLCIFVQLCQKFPIGYNRTPHIKLKTPKITPKHWAISNTNYVLHPQTQTSQQPNAIQIQLANFL